MTVILDKISKLYGSQKALDRVSFSVDKGEIVGFLGPNGAGKSTTMKILSCYIKPTGGTATVNGHDIHLNPMEVKASLGYLPERNPLYDEMYVREYLCFVAKVFASKINSNQRVTEVMEVTGLGPERHKKIGALSKGYRQRVGLAQALIHDPEVLLLDEPTSGLDPNQIIEIRNLIKELGKEKTIILSSHILQEVQAMCSRIVIINKGKIVADQKTDSLIRKSATGLVLTVTFKKEVAGDDLLRLKYVDSARFGNGCWTIHAQNELAREEIYRFAVAGNNIILEMKSETQNLEQIYLNLTSGK